MNLIKKYTAVLLLTLLTLTSYSKDVFVRSGGTGNGSSWATAAGSPSSASLSPGDTMYVGAGNYTATFSPPSGTAALPVKIVAAKDSYVGVATFSTINLSGKSYVIFDGSSGSSKNFATSKYVNAQNSTGVKIGGFTINGAEVDFRFAKLSEIFNSDLYASGSMEWVINFEASANSASFDQSFVNGCYVRVLGQINNGTGGDGIKPGRGVTVTNTTIQAIVGAVSNAEHQDLIQIYGNNYVKVVSCTFIDSGDAQLGVDNGSSTVSNLIFRNNVFRRTILNMGTVMLRIYTSSGTISSFNNVEINGNTFVDGSRTYAWYGAAIRLHAGNGNTSSSNSSMRNNLFYNCGKGWPAILVEGITFNWIVDNNLINAGNSGNSTVSWSGFKQNNGQSGAPKFTSYTEYSLSNDLRLSNSDTSARDKGVVLTSFNTDRNGNVRVSPWDIGAYESSGGIIVPPPVNSFPTVSITSPADNSSFYGPTSVVIFATASDSDGSINRVEFYINDVISTSDNSAPYSSSSVLSAGNYSLKSVAYDNLGGLTVSPQINIRVLSLPATNNIVYVTNTVYVTNIVYLDKWHTNTIEVIPDVASTETTLDKQAKTLNTKTTFK